MLQLTTHGKGKHVKLKAKRGKNAQKGHNGKKKLNRNNKPQHGYVTEGKTAHQALSKI